MAHSTFAETDFPDDDMFEDPEVEAVLAEFDGDPPRREARRPGFIRF